MVEDCGRVKKIRIVFVFNLIFISHALAIGLHVSVKKLHILELEFQTVVVCHVQQELNPGSLKEASGALNWIKVNNMQYSYIETKVVSVVVYVGQLIPTLRWWRQEDELN